MTDLFDHQVTRMGATITAIASAIASTSFDKRVLFAAMTDLHGGGSADGQWSQRDAFEMMEAGVVQHLAVQASPAQLSDVVAYGELVQSLPTQTVRSEDQIRYQQFSTPADLAALAAVLAQARADDIVLEPSAGHGMLAVMLPQVATLHLNELDPRRREKLHLLFAGATITGIDGAMLTSLLPAEVRPTLTILNPPFSRSEGRGADSFAAVRHLRSAIAKTVAGGRIVAIMPDWFTTNARMEAAYKETLADCTVALSCRLSKCYQKQGTSVAVRLYVIDKAPGNISPTVIVRDSVADLASVITIPARRPLRATPVRLVPAGAPKRVARSHALTAVSYEALQQPRALDEQKGVYLPYRPSRIEIAGAAGHPTPLVESVAMGSIPAPIPAYTPTLPEPILTEAGLSEAQLETVIYAGNAWEQFLPGTFKPQEHGVRLKPDANGARYCKGFFLGDGTGAGKGRQVAGCILDNWLAGRCKAIWISKNEPLLLSGH